MQAKLRGEGITFDDVLLVPARSAVVPRDVDTSTQLTQKIRLNVPLLSAPMDTVTEAALAIALAQEGGLGIIHKNLSVEAQAREVEKVKRSENGIITDPIKLPPGESTATARRVMETHNVSGIPIVEAGDRLVGILTRRDMKFLSADTTISNVMTKDNLVTAAPNTSLDEAEKVLNRQKVEKLLLVHPDGRLAGLITMRDIDRTRQFPHSCRDTRGRLRAGAAVSVYDYERVEALIAKDVDVIVVDSAHGHSDNVIRTVEKIKSKHDIDVIAGNVATGEGAADLIAAGADAVKVGIGPGAICTTRVISGVGVPQISAVREAAKVADTKGVAVISDGGVRQSGDITKAIAAGASGVMMGSLFAGLDESPGQTIIYKGRRFKVYRGMGSLGAMVDGSADRYGQKDQTVHEKLVPEGVEGRVPYRGRLADFVYQMVGGLRAGMGYCGAATVEELRTKAKFIRVSAAALAESHPHDIAITHEAPNYSTWAAVEE
ncbi:MAG TPA: IMP dehydrogenase [Phycisphaerae bacterium]|nr:IMP dehydrogenase [Phycisphaerae bacterium]HUT61987.1 IMP dehydrogenase [Phycisphaerae bacterium]